MDNQHFATLMANANMKARLINRTTQIVRLIANIGHQNVMNIIQTNMVNGDAAVIGAFNKLRKPKTDISDDKAWLVKRGDKRAADIDKLFQTHQLAAIKDNAHTLLDIGAGDCYNTVSIGVKSMGLNEANIYAIDIPQWGENTHDEKKDFDINFKFVDPDTVAIPFQTQFNRIIAFQSLHHISNLSNALYEMNRVASLGAIVVIREHDCDSELMSRLIDVEHMLYDTVADDNEYDKFIKSYYGRYRSKFQWTQIFESHMFRRINTKHVIEPGETNYYYAVYQKIGNAKPLAKYSIDVLQIIYAKVSQTDVNKKWKKCEIINEIRNIL
jgi:ubiquinone/menaquinone biosynthesis C-methylase UbiE